MLLPIRGTHPDVQGGFETKASCWRGLQVTSAATLPQWKAWLKLSLILCSKLCVCNYFLKDPIASTYRLKLLCVETGLHVAPMAATFITEDSQIQPASFLPVTHGVQSH